MSAEGPESPSTQSRLEAQPVQLPEVISPSLEDLRVALNAPLPPDEEALIERLHQRLRAYAPRREREPGEEIRPGDEVECDIVTVIDGEVLAGSLKRSAVFEMREFLHLPGFIDQLLSMATFSAKTFDLDLPEDYPIANAAGKTATFFVEARRVFEVDQPELDDVQCLAAAGLGNSVEEAMETVASEIDAEQGDALMVEATQAVLDALADRMTCEVPESAVELELRTSWEQNERPFLEEKSFSEEFILQAQRDFLNNPDLRLDAAHRLKIGMALGAIVKQEDLAPTEEIMEMLLEVAAADVNTPPTQAKQSLGQDPEEARRAAEAALHFAAVEYVMSRAKIEILD